MSKKIWNGQGGSRPRRVMVIAALGAVALTLSSGAPAEAHSHKKLAARLLSAQLECDELTYPYCAVSGKVRIHNNRPKRSGKIVICVGVHVHTANHQNLSYEPPNPFGQGVADVRPGTSRVTTYRSVFDASAGEADHVHVVHVHKHVVHSGGQQC